MINWLKKNWIIGLLFIVVVFILIIKYKISNSVDQENNIQVNNTQVTPIVTVNPITTLIPDNDKTVGGLTVDQINELRMEEYDLFVDGLSEEEYNSLPPTRYPIEEYIDYENSTFKILSFENNQLKVRSKIENKVESENELNKWLKSYVEPINFDIIWE